MFSILIPILFFFFQPFYDDQNVQVTMEPNCRVVLSFTSYIHCDLEQKSIEGQQSNGGHIFKAYIWYLGSAVFLYGNRGFLSLFLG